MIESYQYCLKQPIEIADGGPGGTGEMMLVSDVELIAPSYKNANAVTGIQSLIQQSLASQSSDRELSEEEREKAKAEKEKNKDKPVRELFSPNDAISILASSKVAGNALRDAGNFFESIVLNGGAKLNGAPVRKGDLQKISMFDYQQMLGEYVSNFLLDFLFG